MDKLILPLYFATAITLAAALAACGVAVVSDHVPSAPLMITLLLVGATAGIIGLVLEERVYKS